MQLHVIKGKKLNIHTSRSNIRDKKWNMKQDVLLLQRDKCCFQERIKISRLSFFIRQEVRRQEVNPDPGVSGFFLFCMPLAFFIRSLKDRMLERHLQLWVSFLKTEGVETQNDPFPQGLSNYSLFLDHSHLQGERTEPGNIP